MARQSRKMNFLIDEGIYQELEQLVPPGKRSRVINQALRKELEVLRRQQVVARLHQLSLAGEKLAAEQIAAELAADRGAH